jgi:hypothetical protein
MVLAILHNTQVQWLNGILNKEENAMFRNPDMLPSSGEEWYLNFWFP